MDKAERFFHLPVIKRKGQVPGLAIKVEKEQTPLFKSIIFFYPIDYQDDICEVMRFRYLSNKPFFPLIESK